MGRKLINLIGKRFGNLTVIEYAGKRNCYSVWKCQCDCGSVSNIRRDLLVKAMTRSCGCLRKKLRREGFLKHGNAHTRIYQIWEGMKSRCVNTKHSSYMYYGEKGIKVDQKWNNFEAFYRDMNQSYIDHCNKHGIKQTTIDRIDGNKGYSKENCRWATYKEQNINKKKSVKCNI